MRIDKWIWAVRMVKTRTMATKMCRLERVLINGTAAKASRNVQIDDMVEVRFKRGVKKIYKVIGFTEKRVGAAVAQTLYEDHSPAPPPQTFEIPERRLRGAGRPTKKDRRKLDRLKGE